MKRRKNGEFSIFWFFYNNVGFMERWNKRAHNISTVVTTSHYSDKLQWLYSYINKPPKIDEIC